MIEKKSFDKETIQICSYDISKKESTKSNPRLHLVYPSLYQSDKFVLLESEALWFYIYENVYEELVIQIDYQQSDVAFNLFKRFKRLILYKRYIKCEGEEEDRNGEPSGIRRDDIKYEEYKYREYTALLDFSDIDRVEEPKDSKYRYIKFVFSDKGREEKKRFSSLIFDEDLDMRIMSSIEEEEERTRDKVFDIYKCKVYIDIYLEYYWYKHIEGG